MDGIYYSINGTRFLKTSSNWCTVKHRFGKHTVIVRNAEPASASSIPYAPLGSFTICAVDAKGRFFVRGGEDYCATTFQVEEDYKTTIARREVTVRARKPRRSTFLTPKDSSEGESAVMKRAPTRYSQFQTLFMRHLSGVSFLDGSKEWQQFTADQKKSTPVEELFRIVTLNGKYSLRSQ